MVWKAEGKKDSTGKETIEYKVIAFLFNFFLGYDPKGKQYKVDEYHFQILFRIHIQVTKGSKEFLGCLSAAGLIPRKLRDWRALDILEQGESRSQKPLPRVPGPCGFEINSSTESPKAAERLRCPRNSWTGRVRVTTANAITMGAWVLQVKPTPMQVGARGARLLCFSSWPDTSIANKLHHKT